MPENRLTPSLVCSLLLLLSGCQLGYYGQAVKGHMDLMGARHAGMDIAFVQRPGCAWYPLERSAAFHVQTIEELADALAQGEMS